MLDELQRCEDAIHPNQDLDEDSPEEHQGKRPPPRRRHPGRDADDPPRWEEDTNQAGAEDQWQVNHGHQVLNVRGTRYTLIGVPAASKRLAGPVTGEEAYNIFVELRANVLNYLHLDLDDGEQFGNHLAIRGAMLLYEPSALDKWTGMCLRQDSGTGEFVNHETGRTVMSTGNPRPRVEAELRFFVAKHPWKDGPSISALQVSAKSLRTAMQQGLLEVFCRFVSHPVSGHNLTGAIWKLAHLAPKGNDKACAVISARLRHRRCCVREAAVLALGHMAHSDLVPRIRDCLSDGQGRVRASAAWALSQLTEQGDLETLRATMILLGDESIDACRAAVQCIVTVARQGDENVTRQLTELLGSGCATTRWAALETLSRITLKGNPAVVASLVPCLEDPDPEIRMSAVDALRRVAIHGDPVAVQGALQRLDHRDGSIRAAALRTMSWVAEVGDAAAITKAKGCLDDGVSNVRAAAVETLAKLTPSKGDVEVISCVVARLEDGESFVRTAAMESLVKVADEGDLTAMPALLSLLEHQDGRVRLAAVEALGQLAPKGDEAVLAAVSELLEDRHTGVCCTAVQVLAHLSGKSEEACAAIRARLEDVAGEALRAAAAYALGDQLDLKQEI
ncbi:unnamed protein product [Symbiodinium sp. KB8]|nr:unnamed protein product [Symbiodinium sp. KB8]